ncbi:light harvesting complex photosystem II subunit 6 [Striga hermonthica]|uniref:Chlorophyll a-b binding protein, chloroplastic n=1 Tax=Striga hermonthica TaxID=68872 RepID=A0A9N7N435_STRHE|nr:light harvesting complex photosystem II subunit 6 [Striga hermonthica]
MASTSAALVNGLGSAFLSGGKKTQALLSAPAAARPVASRRLVVAAAVAPKKSWIPAVKGGGNFIDPEWLDGSLAGDFGFDPLGLGRDPAFLKWYRTLKDGVYVPDTDKLDRLKLAEIKHARLAMLAMLIFYFEAGQGKTPLGALGL